MRASPKYPSESVHNTDPDWINGNLGYPEDFYTGPIGQLPHGTATDNPTETGAGKPGNTKSGGGSGGTSSGTGTTSPASTGSFVINIIWDASVRSAPVGFTAGVMAAVQYLERQFTDPVTINISVGYGEVAGSPLGSGYLGESQWSMTSYSYAQIAGALKADASTSVDLSAIAHLPASLPATGSFRTTTAEARALGQLPASGSGLDGAVGFSSAYKYTYDDTNGVAAGTFDLRAIVLHEVTEVMGRDLMTSSAGPSVYQLFHYSSPGVRDFSSTTPGYFSVDGGNTSLAAFNTNSGGDAGDWASAVKHDAADAFLAGGAVNVFSGPDVMAMDAIGWNAAPYQPSAPTGLTVTAFTGALGSASAPAGLAPNMAFATLNEIGGASADAYGYSLGGKGAGAFQLMTAGGVTKLATAAAGVTGATNGAVYSLSLTARDTSGAGSGPSPAYSLDAVVGSTGSDTIQVAALTGSAATPAFIYGLDGNDTINGTGVTAPLWMLSGSGADVLTGGSGVNHYLFDSITSSTASAMDLVTNFHVGKDLLDLSAISTSLKYVGKLTGTTMAANSVGWQVASGNTFVYVNNRSASAGLTGVNMAIDLHGTISLASKNFVL